MRLQNFSNERFGSQLFSFFSFVLEVPDTHNLILFQQESRNNSEALPHQADFEHFKKSAILTFDHETMSKYP